MRHSIKLSYQPQVPFTVSGDTVVKIQHVIHPTECWGLILDRINGPRVYESSCESTTQTAIAHHFLYLNDNEQDSGGTEPGRHNHWERRTRATGLRRKATFQRRHWDNWTTAEQHHRFFLRSAVLSTRNSPRSELHKIVCRLVLHPFWLDLWTFHSVTKELVLALWKSICIYGRQCRFATSMPKNIIRAAISLARQSNLPAPPSPIMLPKWDLYRTIIQKGSFFLKAARTSYEFTVRQLFQVSSLKCSLSAATPVALSS